MSSSERQEQYDSLYLSILQREGNLPAFFDSLFGFLVRRTDYYHLLTESGPRDRGFPPGAALAMVTESFKKHETLFKRTLQQQQQQQQNKQNQQSESASSSAVSAASVAAPKSAPTMSQQQQQQQQKTRASSKPTASATVINPSTGELSYQADSECYNGASREGYTWSQTINGLDLRVNVDRLTVSKGSDVRVKIDRKSIRVECRLSGSQQADSKPQFGVLLDREFSYEVRAQDAVWSLVPSDAVVEVSLEKVQERWWDACFIGEEKINTREIDCSRPITDLDEEAQAKIDQMMFDQRQKQLGLPTSEEAKTLDLLRKAWDAEGSPFKGTPFDPSVISNQMPPELLQQQQQQHP